MPQAGHSGTLRIKAHALPCATISRWHRAVIKILMWLQSLRVLHEPVNFLQALQMLQCRTNL